MAARRHYRSYLLRMWRVSSEETATWRAMLENPATGERRGFANLEDLCTWIKAQADESDASSPAQAKRQGSE